MKKDLFQFTTVESPNLHERMQYDYILHQSGYKVATNGAIIVALKDGYQSALENRLLSKDNVVIERKRFPNWQSARPNEDVKGMRYSITESKFKKWIADVRKRYIEKHGKKKNYDDGWLVQIGESFFSASYFAKALKAMKIIGAKDLMVFTHYTGNGCLFTETENGWVSLMACKRVGDLNDEDVELMVVK